MLKFTINTIYDCYAVYDGLFGKEINYRLGEVLAYSYILEKLNPESKNVLEICSGDISKYKKLFMDNYSFADKVEYYMCDNYGDETKNRVIIHDLEEPLELKFDAIFGFKYTSGTITNSNGDSSYKLYNSVYKNLYNSLNVYGVLIIDVPSVAYNPLIKCVGDEDCDYCEQLNNDIIHTKRYADYRSEINKYIQNELKINTTPKDNVKADYWYTCIYNRLTGETVYNFKKVEFTVNDEPVIQFLIRKNFTIRHFSEYEIIHQLQCGGFVEIQCWNCNFTDCNFVQLDNINQVLNRYEYLKCGNNYLDTDLLTNVIVGVKTHY